MELGQQAQATTSTKAVKASRARRAATLLSAVQKHLVVWAAEVRVATGAVATKVDMLATVPSRPGELAVCELKHTSTLLTEASLWATGELAGFQRQAYAGAVMLHRTAKGAVPWDKISAYVIVTGPAGKVLVRRCPPVALDTITAELRL